MVEAIMGRRKFKKVFAYEVKWKDCEESESTWETLATLKRLGAAKLAMQCDEKIKSKKSGLDTRPLTAKHVARHLENFGLSDEFANSRIEGLSGGQKCKLVETFFLLLVAELINSIL